MPFHRRNQKVSNRKDSWRNKNFDKRGSDLSRSNAVRCKPTERLTEAEAGITEYLFRDLTGVSGIIKSRFCDFHVNEINSLEQVARLTDLSIPEAFREDTVQNSEYDFTSRPDCLSEDLLVAIKKLVDEKSGEPVEIDVTNLLKEDRTKIHECVKKLFGKNVISSTKTNGERKYVEVKLMSKGATRDHRVQWPKNVGEYVYFVVYKEVLDTHQVAFKIADRLKFNPSNITYAGVKDRRAKTSQWFCMKKLHPVKLINGCKCFQNIYVGNLEFKDKPLKLGQLYGNHFRIAIRNVHVDDSLINNVLTHIKENGFINYYGLQRFGNDKEVPTFDIGLKLLQGKWKEACDLILQPKLGDDPYSEITKAKRKYKETSNAKLACKEFRRHNINNCIESRLLQGLAKRNENDYVTALENVPRNNRLLYLHSFQSLVWNKIVSRRIREFGNLDPKPGDLVLLSEEAVVENEDDETSNNSANSKPQIKILQPEDLLNYSKYDIVLPLPGYDVTYPDNIIKSWYEEILAEYSLNIEMSKQKVKTYNLSGTYRHILDKVEDMKWQIVQYDKPEDVLIRSDYEQLNGTTKPEIKFDGQYKGIVLEFSLRSSRYATMVLREILKCDTSSTVQAKLKHENEATEEPAMDIDASSKKRQLENEENCALDKKFKSETENCDLSAELLK